MHLFTLKNRRPQRLHHTGQGYSTIQAWQRLHNICTRGPTLGGRVFGMALRTFLKYLPEREEVCIQIPQHKEFGVPWL